MIFVNRRRIIQNSGIVKDPTKYWYIEKYVYGKLKETVEVPLGTGTTFGSIDSGYSDDTFFGWSISSSSTKKTFTATTKYKNTTTNVKNNLDAKNTLKIYAIYKYVENKLTIKTISSTNDEISITISDDVATAWFYGNVYTVNTMHDLTLKEDHSAYYAKVNNTYITGTLGRSADNTTVYDTYYAGDVIKIKGNTTDIDIGPGIIGHNTVTVACDYEYVSSSTKYRVERDYINIGGGGGGVINPIN